MNKEETKRHLLKAISAELRQQRKVELNISQETFAKRADVAQSTIQYVEAEKFTELSVTTIAGIATATGSPAVFLRSVADRVEQRELEWCDE